MLPPDTIPYYQGLTETVRKHGWACVFVHENGDRDKQVVAYTVGLSSKHVPELMLLTGDDSDAACTMLNQVARRLLDGRFAPRDGVLLFNNRVQLRSIYRDEFFEQCIFAQVWRDEHRIADATGMQIVLANRKGSFPPG